MKRTRYCLALGLGLYALTSVSQDTGLYAKTDRYTLAKLEPTNSQEDILSSPVEIIFSESIKTIGEAYQDLLEGSGYSLRPDDRITSILLSQSLPESHRHLGPMTLRQTIDVLAGSAWLPKADHLHKTISFDLATEFHHRDAELINQLVQGKTNKQPLAKPDPTLEVWVPFSPGGVSWLSPDATEKVQSIIDYYDSQKRKGYESDVVVTGVSFSVGDHGNRVLAAQRADRVTRLLAESGIPLKQIKKTTDVRNSHSQSISAALVGIRASEAIYTDKAIQRASAPPSSTLPVINDRCGKILFQVGSLKKNIETALESCGYSMGRWNFGDSAYELDWSVNRKFEVYLDGLLPVLEFVRDNYLIDFHVNQIDSTVDFRPHVRG